MLNQLSWTTFFEIVIFLAAAYYIFVLFRYYAGDIRQMVQPLPSEKMDQKIPDTLRFEQPEEKHHASSTAVHFAGRENFPDETLEETSELRGKLKQCIQNASGKPFAPAVLIPQIKKLFREFPDQQFSPQRPAINELVVQECERTGTALLTEDEVDAWWNETL
ncbi:hypothetical protein KXQ82_04460 [Mucilaginibacter sp. HMF5004]|uniref:hypothetical protein n=1 Tax=Mucilaginibacter rivuli TaxID=2857527 RepID=UPI001C5FEF4C|nr:hypothetical protein [Mucilaginibacter rivuli]MBW4888950.1 hypothetical protein [Mucilaginibacter rivuli]